MKLEDSMHRIDSHGKNLRIDGVNWGNPHEVFLPVSIDLDYDHDHYYIFILFFLVLLSLLAAAGADTAGATTAGVWPFLSARCRIIKNPVKYLK